MSTHGWARHRHNWAAELSRVLRRSDLTLSMFQFKIQYSNRVTVSRFNNSTSNFDFKILEASGICKVWPNSINIALWTHWISSETEANHFHFCYTSRILDIMLIFRIFSKPSPVEISHTLCFHFVSKNVKYSKLFKTCHHQITRNVKKNGGERRKWIHF